MTRFLDDDKVKMLCAALTQGQGAFTADDAMHVVEWAREIVVNQHVLQLVLMGRVGLIVKEGEVLLLPLGTRIDD